MLRRRKCWGFVTATMLVATCIGCGGYGTVSPVAYEYAKALYSITNRQAAESLDAVRQQIEAAQAANELSSNEAEWLIEIIDDAGGGDWKDANRRCRQMMEDQVRAT